MKLHVSKDLVKNEFACLFYKQLILLELEEGNFMCRLCYEIVFFNFQQILLIITASNII